MSSKIPRRIQRPDTVSNDRFNYICEIMKKCKYEIMVLGSLQNYIKNYVSGSYLDT